MPFCNVQAIYKVGCGNKVDSRKREIVKLIEMIKKDISLMNMLTSKLNLLVKNRLAGSAQRQHQVVTTNLCFAGCDYQSREQNFPALNSSCVYPYQVARGRCQSPFIPHRLNSLRPLPEA